MKIMAANSNLPLARAIAAYLEMPLVDAQVRRFADELTGSTGAKAAKVIATGGLAELIQAETGIFDVVDPNLTLTGLRIINDLNK